MPIRLSLADRFLIQLDKGLRTLTTKPVAKRPTPAANEPEPILSEAESNHVAGLMRVNHAGEISAQGLYHGQALFATTSKVKISLEEASEEENDHLRWCADRLEELGSHTSRLSPLWYAGSFTIGAIAGAAGDRWSLGFVAETEHQVVKHLQTHLQNLPKQDTKTQAILEQMQTDEAHHADMAKSYGGRPLPSPIKAGMNLVSKVMTKTAYHW